MKKKIGLIILLIVFLILGVVIYNLYTYKVATATKVSSLNKQIKTLKSDIRNLKKNTKCDNNCDSFKNTISDLEKNISDNEKCSTCNVTVNNDKGQLITE